MFITKILSSSRANLSSFTFYNQTSRYLFATANKCVYKILNLSTDATTEEIKKSYLELAKKYHPDVSSGEKAQEVDIFERETLFYLGKIQRNFSCL